MPSQINEEHKGALSIRLNLDMYEGKIVFELSSDEMLEEIVEPINITTVHETTLYVTEINERED
ncbi:hypothetical protein [Clostridium formicaceticum]|uniref:Uncharacterized protein n=1 Tax=Clostridium formicaceticum TaxID=1497 RepID=A0AAC9RKK1_9CLOT|nr:hypothetical protein [Clostridium formicaceticum]AOY76804.1 hypothetical protein BJL90_13645 [Clostridium formicaceticum]ARE87272.1 hypothetical protein CLFO_16710 [Clostridium formicaceticum]